MKCLDFDTLLIEDTDKMSMDIRSEINKLVNASEDVEMLNQVYTILNRKHIEHLCENISLANGMVKEHLSVFTDIVERLPGSFESKEAMLKSYGSSGYVDASELLATNKIQSFSSWMMGGPMSVALFNSLSSHSALRSAGIGPGERAFALLNPHIKWSGSSEGGGDIQVGKQAVEIKSRVVNAGRLYDPAKSKFQPQAVEQTLTSVGIDLSGKQSLTAIDYVQNYFPNLTAPQRKSVADSVVKNMFRFTDKTTELHAALVRGDLEGIRRGYGMSSFYNYIATSGFSGILMLDYPSQTSLYFTDIADVMDKIRVTSPQIWGSDRDAMPKVHFSAK